MIDIDKQEAEDGKIMAIFAYIIFLIPLLAAGDNQFARYHTNQGLVLFLAWLILTFVGGVIGLIPFIGWIVATILFSAAPLAFLGFAIYGIINVAQLEAKPLPLIGGITLIKSY
ncbi:hypothetical protein [uncultured Acetobacterium sp.]|jgi:uncharacterized membrane protein|uniref:hypothetical protein n=1 Tax=uncultured Acetobacterium sp. TaxID=217139 RepID=UPI0024243D05|nr:hypothetical protein [uncultured Acetobacterium sp.]MBU4541676.1 hypothetical protein [Bacillota bacterium]